MVSGKVSPVRVISSSKQNVCAAEKLEHTLVLSCGHVDQRGWCRDDDDDDEAARGHPVWTKEGVVLVGY